jgi:hypothetical protein
MADAPMLSASPSGVEVDPLVLDLTNAHLQNSELAAYTIAETLQVGAAHPQHGILHLV